jgi:high-affinity nickel permease
MIGFLPILAVGFFLGMRHATDPDHVIAVTTIVSNQRNSMRAALIGAFWGVGHTVTIFVVGAAIILFNLVIPVRVGLSMEFSVAVMLIILGLMNVAGFMKLALGENEVKQLLLLIDSDENGKISKQEWMKFIPFAHDPGAIPRGTALTL